MVARIEVSAPRPGPFGRPEGAERVRGADAIAEAVQRRCRPGVDVYRISIDDSPDRNMLQISKPGKDGVRVGLMPWVAALQAALARGDWLRPFAFEIWLPKWALPKQPKQPKSGKRAAQSAQAGKAGGAEE